MAEMPEQPTTSVPTSHECGRLERAALRVQAREAADLARELREHRRLLYEAAERAATQSLLLTRESQELLRARVCAYTRMLRAAGEPPERTLVLVKDAVATSFTRRVERWYGRRWLEDVVGWCIDEYYAA